MLFTRLFVSSIKMISYERIDKSDQIDFNKNTGSKNA